MDLREVITGSLYQAILSNGNTIRATVGEKGLCVEGISFDTEETVEILAALQQLGSELGLSYATIAAYDVAYDVLESTSWVKVIEYGYTYTRIQLVGDLK